MTTVQQRLGCKSWRTAREYVNKWAETREAWESENEHTDDLAEAVIIKAIQNNDIPTAKWWLERRRRRAYCINERVQNETQEVPTDDNELRIIIDNDNTQ